MRIGVMYFTGTGSTAKIANDLGLELQVLGSDVDFIHLKRRIKKKEYDFSSYDILGLGCPTYSFRAPRIVDKIINNLNLSPKPFFVFLSCGGMPGNTLWNLYKLMYKRGGKCLGSLNTYSSNNLRSWRSKTSSSEPVGDGFGSHQIIRTREFAHQILENYQKIIVEKTAKPKRILPKPFWSFYSLFFTYNWQMRTILGKKYVLEDKCIKCGLCSDKICPSGCISLNNEGVPVFNESKCVGCQGCVSLCPELAIETKKCKNKYPYDIYRKYLLKSLPVEEEL